MSIEAALTARLSDAAAPGMAALHALLRPEAIVFGTLQRGREPSAGRGRSFAPHATLSNEGAIDVRTNCGRTERSEIRVKVYHDVHAKAVAIREALLSALDGSDWTAADVAVSSCLRRPGSGLLIQDSDGIWMLMLDFDLLHTAALAAV